ncbi:MAG: alanine racemase [Erysipelotrichales bacterium]|nr:alanine racemase [Erysipelotrichales bacterium]
MRAFLEISKENLVYNYKTIKERTNKDIICVIKSNAYGHGLIEVAKTLVPLNPKMFAVSTIEEAALIRKNLIFTPILLLGTCDNLSFASNYRITLTIVSIDYLKTLISANLPIFVHLLVNTGMNRDGLDENEIKEALELIKNSKLLLRGIFTHFASNDTYELQNELFEQILNNIPHEKLLIHSQATSTMLKNNNSSTAIRVGLALYGLNNDLDLKPVLTLKAYPIVERKVNGHEKISYNSEPVEKEGYIYTLPIGYADGLNRNIKLSVFANDKYYDQIGVMCMDHLMIFSDDELPKQTCFEIIGEHISIIDLANKNATIPYEIVAKLSSRLKRLLK